MAETKVDARVLAGDVPETKGWYAWNDLMPPRPDEVHVVGEVMVSNPGVVPELSYRIPQGINPAILLLELRLVQQAGIWPQVLVWKPVRYDAVLGFTLYERAVVFYGTETVIGLDVETVHLDKRARYLGSESAGFRTTRLRLAPDEVPLPRRSGVVWSGENPFPWMLPRHPVCFSGNLSAIQMDICMDGVRYALTISENVRVRVRGANDDVAATLDAFARQRIIIRVCGRLKWSTEGGCQYLLAESADPA